MTMLRALQSKTLSASAKVGTRRVHASPSSRYDLASTVYRRWRGPSPLLLARTLSSKNDNPSNNKNNANKMNFDRRILQPAQQGNLGKKHSSGIPRLAARKHKAHLTPVVGRAGQRGPPPAATDEWLDRGEGEDSGALEPYDGSSGGGDNGTMSNEESVKYLMEDYDPYFAFELFDDNKYYWREEEYEDLIDDIDETDFFGPDGKDLFEMEFTEKDMARQPLWDPTTAQILEEISREANGEGVGTSNLSSLVVQDKQSEKAATEGDKAEPKYRGMDPEEWFFSGSHDIKELPNREDLMEEEDSFGPPEKLRKEVVELNPYHGLGLDGFVQAMQEHPTEYARVSMLKQTPATTREPKPNFPKNRQPHPPLEFVEEHKRFIYVTGLPPLVINGEEGDLENPVHRSFLEKLVGRIAGVDSTQVWPVNRSSAFVGFFTPRAMADTLKAGPSEKVLALLPTVNLLSATDDATNPFAGTEADSVVQLTPIPPGHTPSSLLRAVFPPDSEVETIFGSTLDASNDVYFLSSTKALLRFPSAEAAAAAASSQLWKDRLKDVGLYPIRYFRARRELVHGGLTGPVKDDEFRVMGPRLIVDGDMPSKEFFLSHPRCIHVRNLDPVTATPEMLTELFQPFSELPRLVGSVEFVTCEEGKPTDQAYIGFDTPGEAEACVKACNGLMRIGDRKVLLRLVQDRGVPHQPKYRPEKRPSRSADELWDDLTNWEKYVDPADVEYLDKNGAPKVVLDEVFRKIRQNNATFGPLDNALRNESLEPEKAPGQMYKELVQLYIETLKECVATPENVGPYYEAIHMPDQGIDLSIFDDWEKKKAAIEKSRARE